jgi:hypothetical protein
MVEWTTTTDLHILWYFELQEIIMRFPLSQLAVAAFITAAAAQTQYTATGAAAVAKARATALTESPTSYVKGKTFDRFVAIFLENTDYDSAAADREAPLLSCTCNTC